jgi:hypothetical protein
MNKSRVHDRGAISLLKAGKQPRRSGRESGQSHASGKICTRLYRWAMLDELAREMATLKRDDPQRKEIIE